MEKICVLIPSYNEAKTIGGLIRNLKSRFKNIYVVDDGSRDNTASVAISEGAAVVVHEKNKGKGASLREGFKHIIKRGFNTVLIMDGDGQHDASDIDNFIKKMDESGADIIVGNRMLDTSSMPLMRIATNRFMSFIISRICGQRVPDTQCGFRLIKSDVLHKIDLKSSNYEIESEILLKAARNGFKIESVPIKTVYNNELSRINPFVDTIRFLSFLVKTAGR